MHWPRAKIIFQHDIQEWECSAFSHDTNHLIQPLGLYDRGLDEALSPYHIFTGIYTKIKYIAIWKKHRFTDPMHVHWLFWKRWGMRVISPHHCYKPFGKINVPVNTVIIYQSCKLGNVICETSTNWKLSWTSSQQTLPSFRCALHMKKCFFCMNFSI